MKKNKQSNQKEKKKVKTSKIKRFIVDNSVVIGIILTILGLLITAYNVGKSDFYNRVSLSSSKNPYLDYNPKFTYSRYTDMEYINSELAPNLEIVEKNNLDSAYLISSDYKIEKLEVGRENEELETHIKNINVSNIDLKIGNNEYRYKFLVLKSIDKDYDMYLIGLKTTVDENQKITFSPLIYSEEQILMLEKYEIDNSNYEGERQIAGQYKEIVKWYRENTFRI